MSERVNRAGATATIREVEIHVHEKGGVLGIDRQVDVKDGVLKVVVNGVERARQRLEPDTEERLRQLAERLPNGCRIGRYDGPRIGDSMETTIKIAQNGRSQQLRVQSGDDAPEQVWDLLGAVSEISPE
jgi:hypothetical protein